MSGEPDVEERALEHARRVICGDPGARDDLAPGATEQPADLVGRLLAARFREVAIIAHARIGGYHILKMRYGGETSVVIQTRWVRSGEGHWRIHEAEVVPGASGDSWS